MSAKAKYRIDSREDWLNAAVAELRPHFARAGYVMHQKVRVSCGWPGGRSGKGGKRIGECWSRECSTGGNFELFISPVLAESERVLDVLVHELVHVVVGLKAGHRATFAKCAAAVHLVAPWTATTAGPGFAEHVAGPCSRRWACPILMRRCCRASTPGPRSRERGSSSARARAAGPSGA